MGRKGMKQHGKEEEMKDHGKEEVNYGKEGVKHGKEGVKHPGKEGLKHHGKEGLEDFSPIDAHFQSHPDKSASSQDKAYFLLFYFLVEKYIFIHSS